MESIAQILRRSELELLDIWKQRVVKNVEAAQAKNLLALYDHMPTIINDLADIISRYDRTDELLKDEKYQEIVESSIQHGRQRAITPRYDVKQVVHEYIIFHRVITEYLADHAAFDLRVSNLVKYVIETAILESVGSFSASLQNMQEKLIGTVAHDIRNPLTVAKASLELLREDPEKENSEKLMNAATRSLNKSLTLIEGLLDGITVKAGEGMLLKFEERNLIEDISWVYHESVEIYSREITLDCDCKEIKGVFDGMAIRRIVENLITNAIKYGSPEKPISLTVEEKEEVVELKVHNFGNPISSDNKDNIFGFLNSEKESDQEIQRSWGMGLTLVRLVTQAHGGSVSFKSSQEEGTTFSVLLPKYFNQPGERRTRISKDVLNT